MKRFEGILICTDLDGTLLGDDRRISQENLDAIEHFKAEGGLFTFITGRMPYFVRDIYEVIEPNAPFGCCNGGGIYDHRKGEYVWQQTMPHAVLELVKYVERCMPDIGIQVNLFDKIYFCRENDTMVRFRKITKVPYLVRAYDEIDEPIAKILFGHEQGARLDELAALLMQHPKAPAYDYIRSEDTLYEILPKGISKGSVLPRLAQHLQIDMRKTVAIGDYDNDISMLHTAQVGVAVANASPAAKAAANYHTVSNNQHAIAQIIADIEQGKLPL